MNAESVASIPGSIAPRDTDGIAKTRKGENTKQARAAGRGRIADVAPYCGRFRVFVLPRFRDCPVTMLQALIFAIFLAAPLCSADAAPVAFEFKDAVKYEGRSVLQYRALEFRSHPVCPLGDDRKFPLGAQYGVVPVGPNQKTALAIVWIPKAAGGADLWLDANGDGRLSDDERHVMTGREIEIPASITVQPGQGTGSFFGPFPRSLGTRVPAEKCACPVGSRGTVPIFAANTALAKEQVVSAAKIGTVPCERLHRTLLFRRSTLGDGLRYAVRGYMQGRLTLGGVSRAVLLIDGNADGCFDSVGQDRVWIDLNGDRHFDPLTEQFPLGKTIPYHGEVYVVRSDATASAVVASLRSAGQGKLRLVLPHTLPASAKIAAELVSDLGELVSVDKLNDCTPVPFGEYRLSSLTLETPDSHGQVWNYAFYSSKTRNYAVPSRKETTVTLLANLTMNVSLEQPDDKISPGQTLSIRPELIADQSLELRSCTLGKPGDLSPMRAEGNAEILLLGPNGKVVTRGLTGFS